MNNEPREKVDRLTITLAPGQREALHELAKANHTTLAYVVRYALAQFLEEHSGPQMRLDLRFCPSAKWR